SVQWGDAPASRPDAEPIWGEVRRLRSDLWKRLLLARPEQGERRTEYRLDLHSGQSVDAEHLCSAGSVESLPKHDERRSGHDSSHLYKLYSEQCGRGRRQIFRRWFRRGLLGWERHLSKPQRSDKDRSQPHLELELQLRL